MRFNFILSFALSLLLTHQLSGQDLVRRNIIKINPFGTLASAIPLSYERVFYDGAFSVVAGGSIINNKSGSGQTTYNNSGYTITPEIRHYFYSDHDLPARLYAGAYFNYEEHKNTSLDRLNNAIDGYAFGRGGGVMFGNQWVFKNGFTADFYIGPGYMSYSRSEEYDINLGKGGLLPSLTGQKNSGTKVKFGFALGISF